MVSSINSSISGNVVTFTIFADKLDPNIGSTWGVYIQSHTDRGLGQVGRDPYYPYYVEEFHGTGYGSFTVVKTEIPDDYVAVLASAGSELDYTMFTVLPLPPKAQIFNWCWGETGKLGTTCPIPTSLPAVKAGTVIDIKADIANSGTAGRIMVIYKIDGLALFTDTNVNLGTYPSGGMWSPTFTGYTMPNKNVTLSIESYNWDGTKWVLGQTKTQVISMIVAGCTGIDLVPFSASIKTGEKVDFVTNVSPGNVPFVVTFKDRSGTTLGTCKTSGMGLATGSSTCLFTWDSNASYAGSGKAGTFYIKAYTNSCMSTESTIVVNAPILQYNFGITVKDSVTGAFIPGATVLVATTGGASQSKVTDISGLALFRMDTGTINVSISKNGYNTFNTVESLYTDMSKTYSFVPIPPTPTVGDVQFVSVPSNADIYIDGKLATTIGTKTPATITNIPAGSHNWSLKLLGYNDSNGTVTVPSGGTASIYATLTPVTPTMGSLNITSTPMGAEVWIDGKDMKVTTSGMTIITDITPGNHTYTLTMTGYQDKTGTFTIIAGQTTFLNPILVPLTTTGSLEITTEPIGARVYIDDTDTQRITPATIINLIAGDHTYKLVLNLYKDVTGKFTIIAGQANIVHIILEKLPLPSGTGALITGIAAIAVLGLALRKKE